MHDNGLCLHLSDEHLVLVTWENVALPSGRTSRWFSVSGLRRSSKLSKICWTTKT